MTKHADDCDWHVDQYPWECTCGAIPRKAAMDELIADSAEEMTKYPAWICSPCGDKWGRRECGIATWHTNTCCICGERRAVTEPRDFGHLKDGWENA